MTLSPDGGNGVWVVVHDGSCAAIGNEEFVETLGTPNHSSGGDGPLPDVLGLRGKACIAVHVDDPSMKNGHKWGDEVVSCGDLK